MSEAESINREILSFERNRSIRYQVIVSSFKAVIEYRLEDHHGRTLVTQFLEAIPQNPILKILFALMGPMMSRPAGKRLLNDLTRLKQAVEVP